MATIEFQVVADSGDIVSFYLTGTADGNRVLQKSEIEALITTLAGTERMRWLNEWHPGSYSRNDTVFDSGWAMVANQDTSERPAPQPTGDPYWVTQLPDPPGFTTEQGTARQLVRGIRVTADKGGYLNGLRLYSPDGNTDIKYQLWVIGDPLGAPRYNLVGNYSLDTVGWSELIIPSQIVTQGSVIDFVVIISDTSGGTQTFDGDWDYQRDDGTDPGAGEMFAAKDNVTISINQVDNAAADRYSELVNLVAGDEIILDGQTWVIFEVVGYANNAFTFTVNGPNRTDEDLYNVTFVRHLLALIDYVERPGWFNSVPNVSGLYSDTDYGSVVTTLDAYGIDAQVQAASVSTHWDLLAYSSLASGSGGGGGGGTDKLVSIIATDPTADYLANKIEALAPLALSINTDPGGDKLTIAYNGASIPGGSALNQVLQWNGVDAWEAASIITLIPAATPSRNPNLFYLHNTKKNLQYTDPDEVTGNLADDKGSSNELLHIWSGTQAQYDALTPAADTIYFIE